MGGIRITWIGLVVGLALYACGDVSLDPGETSGSIDGSLDPEPDSNLLPPLPDMFVVVDAAPDTDAETEPDNRCASGDDCDSGYCVPDPEGQRVCTELCREDTDCPAGWECRAVANTRPDVVFICVATRRVQCLDCEHDGQCGAGNDRCIQVGQSLRCARDCSTEDCPEGNSCQMQNVDGVDLPLCIPDAESCAPCVDLDGDGYGNEGECLGLDCNDDNPDINSGAVEICDGIDNNCNSEPDDGLTAEDAPDDFVCLQEGVCDGAVAACANDAWECTYPDAFEGDAESTCDGLDNDCDGLVDEALDAPAADQVVGVCIDAVKICAGVEGFVEPDYEEIEGYEAEELACDGLDNDCDNETDEAVDRPVASLQDGVCAGAFQVCGGDGGFVEPDYGQIETYENVEATCDALDNDCDGTADEALQPPLSQNQNGVCAGAVQACDGANGFVEPNYGDIASHQAEENTCDGLDNDCDITVDEGVVLELADNQNGVCAESRKICAGPAGLQEPNYGDIATYQNVESTCDGLDNDCDGSADEALQQPQGQNQNGVCAGALQVCDGANGFAEPNYGDIAGHQAEENTCDGLDNDCDTTVDEGVVLDLADQQLGVCAESRKVCSGGAGIQEPNYAGIATYENIENTCDGLDNDCDGSADEALQQPQGQNQNGVCAGALQDCAGADGFVEPNYGAIAGHQAEEATCDGLDNDCDANVDEGVVLDLADQQNGVCAESRKICAGAAGIQEPNYAGIDTYENVESTCDGLDNDCDGNADEALEYPQADNQNGVCAGALRVCGAEAGFVEPDYAAIEGHEADEATCDGLDNDCDGSADEALEQPLADNQNGVCAGALKLCRGQDGFLDPDYADIDGYEIDETTCDGLDNDCDGNVDEGIDLGPADNQVGICAGATKVCAGDRGIVDPDYTLLADYADDDHPADNLDTNCDGVVGTAELMVYVSALGDDRANGLTPATPVASLHRGLAIAAQNQEAGRNAVAIATGSYESNATLELVSGIGLYGGFSRDFASRDATLAAFNTSAAIGVEANTLTAVTHLNGIEVAVSSQDGAGVEVVGLRYHGSEDRLRLENVRIRVGNGGNGTDGAAGANGNNGGGGNNASGRDAGGGGAGGGGAGGRGNSRAAGNPGSRGANNAARGGNGGNPNNGGLRCNDGDVQSGANGQSGSGAANGGHNGAGNAFGGFGGVDWIPSNGSNGNPGGQGGGGGGGAAGGGENCTTQICETIFGVRICGPDVCLFCGTGRGGGGGGGGGTGGRGGIRGLSAGASIGILIRESTLRLTDTQIIVAGGGRGGTGGTGGVGGQGGAGGAGANGDGSDGDGGNGGGGGRGGNGGCGAGGSGGPSVGIWGIADARVVRAGDADDNIAAGGAGGASCGNAGPQGISAIYRGVDL